MMQIEEQIQDKDLANPNTSQKVSSLKGLVCHGGSWSAIKNVGMDQIAQLFPIPHLHISALAPETGFDFITYFAVRCWF